MKSKGFSLIELSIVLLIAGILAVPLLHAYNIYKVQQQEDVTERRMVIIIDAINKFIVEQKRYPVPASFADTEGSATFGQEGNNAPQSCLSASWFTTDGMCRTPGASSVLIGAVPHAALGLSGEEALDYWGNKFLYAVTLTQTSAGTYVDGDGTAPYTGVIEVQALEGADPSTGDPGTLVTVERSGVDLLMEMVLLSHGKNGAGAYTAAGVSYGKACDSGSVTEFDDENCDMDAVFTLDRHPNGTSVNQPSLRSLQEGAGRYYDDYTAAQVIPARGRWADVNLPTPQPLVWTGATRLGIGTTTPDLGVKIHVEGDVASDANVVSQLICNRDGSACFDPRIIVGSDPNMDCNDKGAPGSDPVIGIGNSRVDCGVARDSGGAPLDGEKAFRFDSSDVQSLTCPPGDLMTGIDSAGVPQCATPTP